MAFSTILRVDIRSKLSQPVNRDEGGEGKMKAEGLPARAREGKGRAYCPGKVATDRIGLWRVKDITYSCEGLRGFFRAVRQSNCCSSPLQNLLA